MQSTSVLLLQLSGSKVLREYLVNNLFEIMFRMYTGFVFQLVVWIFLTYGLL